MTTIFILMSCLYTSDPNWSSANGCSPNYNLTFSTSEACLKHSAYLNALAEAERARRSKNVRYSPLVETTKCYSREIQTWKEVQ